MRILFGLMVLLSVIYLAFVSLYKFPADVDLQNLNSGIKNAYKMLGCTLGIFVSFEVERKYINFETDGNFLCQALKLIIGIIPLLGIKEGLRYPLKLIFGTNYIADGIRYFILVSFAACVWPLTFKFFKKITSKK